MIPESRPSMAPKYEPVSAPPQVDAERYADERGTSEESDLPLIENNDKLEKDYTSSKKHRATCIFWLFGQITSAILSGIKKAFARPLVTANMILLQLFMGIMAYHWRQEHVLNTKLKAVSLHSPMLDRVNIPLVNRKSYAQYGMGGPEIWRTEPNDEVDKAWERVTAEYIFPVKESDIIAMRKDPSVVVPMPDKPEYRVDGERTYLAKAAAFHNVHCLDYIRKAVYKDYYYPNGTDDNPFHAYHTAHCIMVLFEHLTCSGDPGVYLYRWMDEFNRPIADTNIWRKCWDFETAMEEHDELSIKDITEEDIRKPRGAKEVPAPDGVMNIINEYRKSHPDYNPGQ